MFKVSLEDMNMPVWVVDVYTTRNDRLPDHRALAGGNTEEEALEAASRHYTSEELVVSVGSAPARAIPVSHGSDVFPLW